MNNKLKYDMYINGLFKVILIILLIQLLFFFEITSHFIQSYFLIHEDLIFILFNLLWLFLAIDYK